MPSAALIEVLEWPTPNVSYSLSARSRERREPAVLLDRVQLLAAAGQHLVRIGLVADVPDQAVVRRVVDVVQRDGQLDRAQAGGEMPAARADGLDQEFAQFGGQLLEAPLRQRAQVRGRGDRRSRVWVVSAAATADSLLHAVDDVMGERAQRHRSPRPVRQRGERAVAMLARQLRAAPRARRRSGSWACRARRRRRRACRAAPCRR